MYDNCVDLGVVPLNLCVGLCVYTVYFCSTAYHLACFVRTHFVRCARGSVLRVQPWCELLFALLVFTFTSPLCSCRIEYDEEEVRCSNL